jgi:hypothetical protein
MGQKLSSNNNTNDIQTPIEKYLQELLDYTDNCKDFKSLQILNNINLTIHTLLKKTPHNLIELAHKSIYPEHNSKNINIDDIINYYNNKLYAIIFIYSEREILMKEFHNPSSTIHKLNDITMKINQLDNFSKLLVE